MSKIIYKHKKTEDLVIKKGNYFHFLNDECPSEENKLPKLMVIGSGDWELITGNGIETYELLLDDSNEIYFKSIVTEQEYRIGDKITIQQNMSFGDGKRNFVIRNWHLSSTPVERNIFSYVYVITECDGRSIHLNDIIVKEN